MQQHDLACKNPSFHSVSMRKETIPCSQQLLKAANYKGFDTRLLPYPASLLPARM
jgi:hypothetical protein